MTNAFGVNDDRVSKAFGAKKSLSMIERHAGSYKRAAQVSGKTGAGQKAQSGFGPAAQRRMTPGRTSRYGSTTPKNSSEMNPFGVDDTRVSKGLSRNQVAAYTKLAAKDAKQAGSTRERKEIFHAQRKLSNGGLMDPMATRFNPGSWRTDQQDTLPRLQRMVDRARASRNDPMLAHQRKAAKYKERRLGLKYGYAKPRKDIIPPSTKSEGGPLP